MISMSKLINLGGIIGFTQKQIAIAFLRLHGSVWPNSPKHQVPKTPKQAYVSKWKIGTV